MASSGIPCHQWRNTDEFLGICSLVWWLPQEFQQVLEIPQIVPTQSVNDQITVLYHFVESPFILDVDDAAVNLADCLYIGIQIRYNYVGIHFDLVVIPESFQKLRAYVVIDFVNENLLLVFLSCGLVVIDFFRNLNRLRLS